VNVQIVEPTRLGRSPGLDWEIFAEDPGRALATVVWLDPNFQSKSIKLMIEFGTIIQTQSKPFRNEDLKPKYGGPDTALLGLSRRNGSRTQ
jgi:hypothetical protein